jgi:predicted transcriptional regulator of viral defense system
MSPAGARSTAVRQKIVRYMQTHGVQRTRDLERLGVSRQHLSKLVAEGVIERIQRGTYTLPDAEITEHRTLVEASKRVPKGVICLLSALRFHDLTTLSPFEVWMAIHMKARQPRLSYPTIKIMRFSGKALTSGIKRYRVEGVSVPVYVAAKTVADCFKFRNKIGLDVALEALRDCWRQRKATMDALWKYAKVCRVANVMRPYLESLA